MMDASAPPTELAIAARGLVKTFGNVRAVDGIDLEVPRGMIFAVLGPNGAGKTTLMRMLATLTTPDSGAASILGHDLVDQPQAVRGVIAMTGQFASLDEDLTARENLVLVALLFQMPVDDPPHEIAAGRTVGGGYGIHGVQGLVR